MENLGDMPSTHILLKKKREKEFYPFTIENLHSRWQKFVDNKDNYIIS